MEAMGIDKVIKTLKGLDVSQYVKNKQNMTYLPWASAWDILLHHFPGATKEILPLVTFADGSVEVWTSVTIEGHTRSMWLPVMDFKNKSIVNPTSRDISDSRMRCLVKNLALFGLGLYLYEGEGVPRKTESVMVEKRELTPDMTKAWENAQKAFNKYGNLDKVKERFTLSSDNEAFLKETASHV